MYAYSGPYARFVNPLGIRTGTELNPIRTAGGGILFGGAGVPVVGPAGGVPVYYSNGFASAGAGQTSAGGGILSAITSGLETALPAVFGRTITGVTGQPVKLPPMTAGGGGGGVITKAGGAIVKTASQHPVLTAAGGAAATVGGVLLARHMSKAARKAAGMHVGRRMNPCNIHALRRGLRRASAFERIAKRVLHITSPRKHVSGFKLPHRRKK